MGLFDLAGLEPWWRFAAAALLGALVGLEREHAQQSEGRRDFAGIRTFALMGLLGAVAALVADERGPAYFLAAYGVMGLLVTASYVAARTPGARGEGVTTEVAALLVPLLGALVVWDHAELGLALAVVTAVILALKEWLHGLARRMSDEDLAATLEFALMALVILPLLPNEPVGPQQILNPFQIWLMVVLVSGISFLGYILMKALGPEHGVEITAVLGGLVSSTAATVSLAGRSKRAEALSRLLALGVLLASCVMLVRVLVEVAVVHAPLLPGLAPIFGAMLAVGVAAALLLERLAERPDSAPEAMDLGNPLRVRMALAFGVVYALVLLVLDAAESRVGPSAVYGAAALGGLTDVDAVTLSAANLVRGGRLSSEVGATAIAVAALVNTATKAVLAALLGSRELRRTTLAAFAAMGAAGAVALLLTLR